MNKIFTGIGSRNAPNDILIKIRNLSYHLCKNGWILYSGGAEGCDSYAEIGCDKAHGSKMIFIPWKNFNNNFSTLHTIPDEAYDIAREFHPNYHNLQSSTKKLMARSTLQILGQDLKSPSSCVICWTPEGKDVGGTSQAIRIARHYKIPVFNLYFDDAIDNIKQFTQLK